MKRDGGGGGACASDEAEKSGTYDHPLPIASPRDALPGSQPVRHRGNEREKNRISLLPSGPSSGPYGPYGASELTATELKVEISSL